MKGEGLSGILINLYCHMWEGLSLGVQDGNVTYSTLGSSLSNRLTVNWGLLEWVPTI